MTGSPFVSVDDLATLLDDGRVTVLDVRWDGTSQPDAYARGHVPTARYVDLEADLAGPAGPKGRLPLPASTAFVETARALGVGSDEPVVLYDDIGSAAAARGWWILRHLGHPAVSVLDGGLRAWRESGRELRRGPSPVPPRGDFAGAPGGMPVLDVDDVLAFAEQHLLVDARQADRHRGDGETVDPVAGHVPGSVNLPARDFVDDHGLLLPADEIRARLARDGVVEGAPVAFYCGSGLAAAHQVLVLDAVGISAALYPGSWSHWITDPARPVARGAR